MKMRLLKTLLKWYRGRLEDQINTDVFDPKLSHRLEAVTLLLED